MWRELVYKYQVLLDRKANNQKQKLVPWAEREKGRERAHESL